ALYAYRQHGGNVIGHYVGQAHRPLVSRILGRLRSVSALTHSLRARLRVAQHGYRILARTIVIARTLEARLAGRATAEKLGVISRIAKMERSLSTVVGE